MKTIFTLIGTFFLSLSLFASSPKSILTISSISKAPVIVTIDNRSCDVNNSNDVIMRDIHAGYHNIKIFQEKNKRNNKKRQLIYSGNVYVRPGFHVDITLNRFGKAFIDERQINSGYNDNNDNDSNNDDHFKEPMSQDQFDQFTQTICNNSFDNSKLAIAQQAISTNYFTAAQVKELVGLFSFENNKLGIAKSAYRRTIDKSNYFMVSDALVFSSSKEELATFLQTSR